jgi:glycosyltransferase involved in cell wall biosynthesis
MKISIAMATYNGAKYIHEQIKSFLTQTRLPSELIINDDCSSDATLNIINEFSKNAPFEVKFYKNQTTVGFSRNFELAIARCQGDIIFISDQDDVWLPHKIDRITSKFIEDPKKLVIINDSLISDKELHITELTVLSQLLSLGLSNDKFCYGCCSAITKSFKNVFLPLPTLDYAYDSWLHTLSGILGCRYVLQETLQIYRRHESNASHSLSSKTVPVTSIDFYKAYSSEDSLFWCKKREKILDSVEKRLIFLLMYNNCVLSDISLKRALDQLHFEKTAVEARTNVLSKSKINRIFPALLMYARKQYCPFSGWKSLAKDLLL